MDTPKATNPKRCALIIVDPQNDFGSSDGALYVPKGEEIVEAINVLRKTLQEDLAAVFITQDWHPENHVSFVTNNPGTNLFETIELPDGTKQKMWPPHCVQGSIGADFLEGLDVKRTDTIIPKGTKTDADSYSGFGSADGTSERTILLPLIREMGITHAIVVGLALEYCVSYTVKDACRNGIKTCVYLPACRGISVDDCATEMAEMTGMGATLAYGLAGAYEFVK